MPQQVGFCVHADVLRERRLRHHHGHSGGHQAVENARRHFSARTAEPHNEQTQKRDDDQLAVDLEVRQALPFDIGLGKVTGNHPCHQQ